MGLWLKEGYSEFIQRQLWLLRPLNDLKESAAVQLFITYRNHIALLLHMLCIAGCGYWIYRFMVIEVTPLNYSFVTITDPQDARIFLSFGIFGAVFIVLFSCFILKFIYNILHDGIYKLLPTRWYSFGRSISYLILLSLAFTYIKHAKVAGLTIYNRVEEIMDISRQYDEIVLKNLSDVQELFKKMDDRVEEAEN
jgi:hypothetical protein